MGLPKQRAALVTPEEYLKLEREAEFRHEYLNGEIFGMAGATKCHNLIAANLIRLVGTQLVGRNYKVYGSDMRIKIPSANYTYPDVVAVCGDDLFEDELDDTLLNPLLVIEVLSKSTEAYDRGAKFEQYQTIENFREYVLISQEPFRVEQFVRQDANTWKYSEFRSPEQIVKLDSVACELSLKDIYYRVEQKFPKELG